MTGLLAYVIASFGFLPAPSMVRNLLGIHGAERFPCESHACGCTDAELCRTDCCCYSPSEIRAWARSNHLDPEGWAVLDTPTEPEQPTGAAGGSSEPVCPMCALHEPEPGSAVAAEDNSLELPGVAPLGCKQISHWMLLAPTITTRPRPAALRLADSAPSLPLRRDIDGRWRSRALEIPEPPPRIV
ncbi:MAG: hypothetical protein H6813_07820 [Phycisphaeraceae bacterium]|nr:hypothetical protein [Phycisphaeraceae bacterium]